MKSIMPLGLAALSGVLLASPAMADPFNGPYAGMQAGWSHTRVGDPATDAGRPNLQQSQDAAEGGIFADYNYKVTPKIVLSAEGGFSIGIDDAIRRTGTDTAATVNPRYAFDLGARAGYLVDDATLVYVRGGYENMRAAVRIADGTAVRTARQNFDGWSVVGGVERAINDWLSVRAEYRYSDLRDKGTFERHQALLGVAYHF